jgi:hypothetical protein
MTRHYIKDENGKDQKDSEGRRTFWSDSDGDWDPDHSQTVYHEIEYGGGNKKDNTVTYDPSKGKFNKK